MKPLKTVFKQSSKKELLEVILAALDCHTHFHKPTIIENDKDFKMGLGAIVICQACVERMKMALGIDPKDKNPNTSNFGYFYNRPEGD